MNLNPYYYSPQPVKPRMGRELTYKMNDTFVEPKPILSQSQDLKPLNQGMIALGLLLGVLVAGASDFIKHKLSEAIHPFKSLR